MSADGIRLAELHLPRGLFAHPLCAKPQQDVAEALEAVARVVRHVPEKEVHREEVKGSRSAAGIVVGSGPGREPGRSRPEPRRRGSGSSKMVP